MVELVEIFAADYQVEEDPSKPAGEHSYDFVATGVSELSPAVEISVIPNVGDSWHGRFFGNYESPSTVVNGPDRNVLVVVAAGVAYVVQVDSPSDYRVIPIWPVRSIHCDQLLRLVLLVSFTDVTALGEEGAVIWEAKELASDGFTEVLPTAATLVVKGYAAAEDREVETTLDLASGVVINRE